MPIPNAPLLWLAAVWLLLGIGALFEPRLLVAWQGYGPAVLAIALADAIAGRERRGRIAVVREAARALPVGTSQTIRLRLAATGAVAGWLRDRPPAGFAADGLPLFFRCGARQSLLVSYQLAITERGQHSFSAVDLRLLSPLRLWLVRHSLPLPQDVRVFPNFARISEYTLLATDNRLSQMGVLRRRRRGEGMEFHQLRDYRQDDSPRQIDWKASSRMGRLISREYQDERDQQIVFLLDCSLRMRAKDGELSHFDHALNALLLLGYVVLRQGDAVGLATFAHARPRYLAPQRSVAKVNDLLNAVYDLQPSLQAPDYLAAADLLLKRLSKRAMIVLATNLRDEDDETLGPALTQLGRRHVVTLASLREPVLTELASAPVSDFDAALTRAAAIEYGNARRRQAARLRHCGVHVVDVSPRDLPVALINHYWQRKRAGNL